MCIQLAKRTQGVLFKLSARIYIFVFTSCLILHYVLSDVGFVFSGVFCECLIGFACASLPVYLNPSPAASSLFVALVFKFSCSVCSIWPAWILELRILPKFCLPGKRLLFLDPRRLWLCTSALFLPHFAFGSTWSETLHGGYLLPFQQKHMDRCGRRTTSHNAEDVQQCSIKHLSALSLFAINNTKVS